LPTIIYVTPIYAPYSSSARHIVCDVTTRLHQQQQQQLRPTSLEKYIIIYASRIATSDYSFYLVLDVLTRVSHSSHNSYILYFSLVTFYLSLSLSFSQLIFTSSEREDLICLTLLTCLHLLYLYLNAYVVSFFSLSFSLTLIATEEQEDIILKTE
jgi:hypothetical protein